MDGDQPRRRQRSALYLEPKRAAATISASFGTLIFAAAGAAALLFQAHVVGSQPGQTLGGILRRRWILWPSSPGVSACSA
jgi:hypothetical protein